MDTEGNMDLMNNLKEMSAKAEHCILLLQDALVYDKISYLDECENIAEDIHNSEKAITPEIISALKENASARSYVAVPGHIERIGDNIEDIIGCFKTKINENIICSDKAMEEISYLFQRIKEVLHNTSDIIIDRDRVLANYIIDAENVIEENADKYATFHEDRMIEGLCLPQASSIFIHVLDAIKGIAWHARQIAEKLTK